MTVPYCASYLLVYLLLSSTYVLSSEKPNEIGAHEQKSLFPDGGAPKIDFELVKAMAEELNQAAGFSQTQVKTQQDKAFHVHSKIGNTSKPPLALDYYLTINRQLPLTKPPCTCQCCASAIKAVGPFVSSNKTMWLEIVKFAKQMCPIITGYSQYACNGYVDLFQPIVYRVLPNVIKSPYRFCEQIFWKSFGSCGAEGNDEASFWEVPLPDPLPGPVILASNEIPKKKMLTALFLADLHIDPDYQPGSPAVCLEPMCCRNTSTPKNSPLTDNETAGYWGDYRKCDAPTWVLDDLLRQVNETHGNEIDFVFVAGDLLPHDTWSRTTKKATDTIDLVAEKLAEKLPGKPVFFAVGNNEGIPAVNEFSLQRVPEEFLTQPLYDKIADISAKWLDSETANAALRKGGFYTTLLKPGWRLMVLNDNYCSAGNFFLYDGPSNNDPFDQLQWMANVLTDAEKKGERVHILGHIPPGSNDCLQSWSWNYYRIISRFAHIITGQFFGHVHRDFFTIYYDAETLTRPKSVMLCGTPGTPYSNNNIGYRLYDFDSRIFMLLNYRQYYADIETANTSGDESKLPWKVEYYAREAYSLVDLSATSWDDFARRMQKNATLLNLHRLHYQLSLARNLKSCDTTCRREHLCAIYRGLSNVPDNWCERFVPV